MSGNRLRTRIRRYLQIGYGVEDVAVKFQLDFSSARKICWSIWNEGLSE